MKQKETWAVISGGGTGGHLYPGIAIASELVKRGHDTSTLRFVGSRRGLEASTNALAGFPVTLLPGRGYKRDLTARAVVANAAALAGEAVAVVRAVALFGRWRPAVVVSLGGYASLPCVVAAVTWRVPLVVVSLDAVPGLVNRIAARFAAACAAGVPGPAPGATALGGPESTVGHASTGSLRRRAWAFTGVPVRPEMAEIDRSPEGRRRARERLGLPVDAQVVVVSGGSLGSLRINRAAARLAELWAGRQDVAVRHVVGRRDWKSFAALQQSDAGSAGLGPQPQAPPGGGATIPAPGRGGDLVYQVVAYEEDMASLYSAADVAVQRAGASTVAELALAGLPSVLVPLPGAPGDHQGANARAMQAAGGAVVIDDADLDGERLSQELDSLISSAALLSRMGEAAKALARAGAASEIADLVERCARRSHLANEVGKELGKEVAGAG